MPPPRVHHPNVCSIYSIERGKDQTVRSIQGSFLATQAVEFPNPCVLLWNMKHFPGAMHAQNQVARSKDKLAS